MKGIMSLISEFDQNVIDFAERINYVLYHTDVMGTCCQENNAFDEYGLIALSIAADVLESGFSLAEAIDGEFASSFGFGNGDEDDEDEEWESVLSPEQVSELVKAIENNTEKLSTM